jgi:hypothetical protein
VTASKGDIVTQATEPIEGVVSGTELDIRRLADVGLYNPDLDFRKLIETRGADAFWTQGFRLVDKDDLLGVPHIIISVTYREGFPRAGVKGDYVSVEAVVGHAELLGSAPVMASIRSQKSDITSVLDLPVFPNEAVVYNDGSTGVRRQITEHLTDKGMIDPGPKVEMLPSRFDRQIQKWAKGSDLLDNRIAAYPDGSGFAYIATRGLRRSDYKYETQDASTWYIA